MACKGLACKVGSNIVTARLADLVGGRMVPVLGLPQGN